MFLIQNILIDERLVTDRFVCETNKCKGACCTLRGGGGAPLLESEISFIDNSLPLVLPYLNKHSQSILEQEGYILKNSDNSLEVNCVDNKDCVFVFYENEIAKCSLEKVYNEGKSQFKKPLSCHLFPIRVRNFGGDFLSFEPFDECKPATEYGNTLNVTIRDFLKEPLIRLYGNDWYEKLQEYAQQAATSDGEVL